MTTSDAAPDLVDWDLAARTAKRLAGSGPVVTEAEAQQAVADLRQAAAEAEQHVRAVTGLDGSSASAPVMIVDRGGWVTANTESLRVLVAPLVKKVQQSRNGRSVWPLDVIGPKATGVETGAFLAFIAGRVLGQFDPFWSGEATSERSGQPRYEAGRAASEEPSATDDAGRRGDERSGQPRYEAGDEWSEQPSATDDAVRGAELVAPRNGTLGRLLLVAPNIVHVERELGVVPRDFRLWVCVHEETHRVQFTAVPWLRDHLAGEIERFVGATQVDGRVLASNVREAVQTLVRAVRGEREAISLVDMVQSPEQKAVVGRVTAVMSLLEGHADVVMDLVGPQIIPTVGTIRRRFQRRRGRGGFDQTVRRLLGLEAKMQQYRDGAKFVNGVVEQVGMEGFNRVWESPETLPTPEEIAAPEQWVRRVHGSGAPGRPAGPAGPV